MLNTHFPTLESILTSLDSEIAAVQESNSFIDHKISESEKVAAQQLESRNSALQQCLPGIFENDAASAAEFAKFPPYLQPVAEQTRAQVQRLNKAKEFGDTVASIDALVVKLNSAQGLEPKGWLYRQICSLVAKLDGTRFGSAKDRLVDEVSTVVAPSKQQALDNFTKSLGSEWPKKNPTTLEFNEAMRICLLFDSDEFDGTSDTFNVLAQELDLRLKFNFEAEQKTRQFDKPEWLFYFFSKLVGPHIQWLKATVQPVLSEIHPDVLAVNAFISALLPSIFRVAKLYLENCKHDHEMLNHFLEESFKFDQDLEDKYFYYFSPEWMGITTTILLNDDDAFRLWKQYEIDAANATFSDLKSNPDAWKIDYDSADTKTSSRTPLLGLGFSSLFDSVTDLYKYLRMPKLQLIFLNEIQLALIDQYVSFLKRYKNNPQADLDDYGKVLGSLGYLIDFLSRRSSNIVFIDLVVSIGFEGGIFDEAIQNLVAFRDSCISEIANLLKRALPDVFKAYAHKKDTNSGEPSQHLYKPVSKLSTRLEFFKNICNVVDFETIKRNLSESIANYLFRSVVQAASFNSEQGKSMGLDIEFIWTQLNLAKIPLYSDLIASAQYFETGNKPENISGDVFYSIQGRRA